MNTREAASRSSRRAIVAAARDLRKRQTRSEQLLWEALRDRRLAGKKFRRQARVRHAIVDFYCASEKLVIEVDGGVHRLQRHADRQRQDLIEDLGLRVIRLSVSTVERDLPAALDKISRAFIR
jgi:very-short-patch-repair endonuclease